jgi:hypothetical protein
MKFEKTTMSKLLFFLLAPLTIICTCSFTNITHVDTTTYFSHSLKTRPLGVSIVLYRVGKAEKVDDLSNLKPNRQIEKCQSL